MKVNTGFLSLIFVAFVACEQTIHLELPEYENELVLYGVLIAGEAPKIFLTESTSYFEPIVNRDRLTSLIDAEVIIREANNVYNLTFDPEMISDSIRRENETDYIDIFLGGYTSNLVIEENKTYTIEVKHKGRTLTGKTKVPEKINLNGAKHEIEFYEYEPSFNDTCWKDNLIVNFDDPMDENFYETKWEIELWGFNNCNDTLIWGDSCLVNISNFYFPVFNDDGFNNMSHTYNLGYFRYGCGDPPDTTNDRKSYLFINKVVMHNVSKELYDFNTSLEMQSNSEDNPFQEPTIIKSTIEGGIGIFASKSAPSDTIEVRVY